MKVIDEDKPPDVLKEIYETGDPDTAKIGQSKKFIRNIKSKV